MPRDALDIAEIARSYYDAVYRFCARRVGVDCAADVAQETFITAQRALARYRGEASLKTWLFGIAHNECRRQSRSRKAEVPLLLIDPQGDSPEESLVNRQALQEALNKLSPEHREIVLMHEIDGLSYEEAASILGVPVGTVKSRLHHAFLNLRKALQPVGGEAR